MSKFVDERVVEMSFDNKRFESNVKTSMGTIDKLKDSLNFSGTANRLNNELSSVNVNALSGSLLSAKNSFTAFEIAGIAAIANITDRVIDLGIQMVKSLSVDNISSGWSKLETSWKKEDQLKRLGYSQEEVDKNIRLLQWFSDETSYSYTSMLDAVTKMVASGMKLEDATKVAIGYSNWAAAEGKSAQEAANLQKQIDQIFQTGFVKRQDWQSISNAVMASQEFQEQALLSAVRNGELIKQLDGTFVTTGKSGGLAGLTFSSEQFVSSLTEGLWFTKEVLADVLGGISSATGEYSNYAGAALDIYDIIQNNEDINTVTEALDLFGDTLDQLEKKWFESAQQAMTFTDVINATKDAVSTGWMSVFQNIFGQVEEAKKLWSGLAYELYDVFMNGILQKIEITSIWGSMGGRNDLFEKTEESTGAFWNLFNAIVAIKDLISGAWQKVFGFSDLEDYDERINDIATKLKTFTENLKDWSAGISNFFKDPTEEMNTLVLDSAVSVGKAIKNIDGSYSDLEGNLIDTNEAVEKLKTNLEVMKYMQFVKGDVTKELEKRKQILETFTNILTGVFSTLKIIGKTIVAVFKGFSPLLDIIKTFAGYILGLFGIVGKEITEFSETTTVFERITVALQNFSYGIIDFVKSLKLLEGIKILIDSFKKSLNKALGDTDKNIVSVNSFRKVVDALSSAFKWLVNIIASHVLPILPKLFDILGKGFGWLVGSIVKLVSKISEIVSGFRDWARNNQTFQNGLIKLRSIMSSIANVFTYVGQKISEFFKSFGKNKTKPVDDFSEDVEKKFTPLKTFLSGLVSLLEGLWHFIKSISSVVGVFFAFIGKGLKFIGDKIKEIFTTSNGDVNFAKLFTVGFWAVVAVGIYRFADMLRSITQVFRDAFDSVFDYFNSKAMMQYMEAIKTMAISILLMVGALLILGSMDTGVLKKSMKALGALMAFMVGVLLLMKNLTAFQVKGSLKDILFKGSDIAAIGTAFTGIAIAILILSYSLKMISNLDPEKMKHSLGIIAIMMVMMIGVMKLVSQSEKGVNKAVKSMVKVAISVALLARPLKVIGSIDTDTGIRGLIGIAGLMFILTMYSRFSKPIEKSQKVIYDLISTAIALNMLIIPLKAFGGMEWTELGKAGAAILGFFIILSGFSKLMSESDMVKLQSLSWSLIKVAISLALFGLSMNVLGSINFWKVVQSLLVLFAVLKILSVINQKLSKDLTKPRMENMARMIWSLIPLSLGMAALGLALRVLGSVNFWSAVQALATLAIVLLGFAFINKKLSKDLTKPRMENMARMIWSLIPLSLGLLAFGLAIRSISSIPWIKIISSLGALSLVILTLIALNKILSISKVNTLSLLGISASLITLSIGLLFFSTAILALGSIPITKLGIGLAAIAGVFIVLAIAGLLLKPLILTLLSLSVVFVLFAVGVFLLVTALTSLVGIMAISAAAFAASLMAMSKAVIIAAPTIIEALKVIARGIVEVFKVLIIELAKAIVEIKPYLYEAFKEILTLIRDLGPFIADALRAVVEPLLDLLIDIIPKIIEIIDMLLFGFIDYLILITPTLVSKLFDFFITLFNSLGDTFRERGAELGEATRNLVSGVFGGLWDAILAFFGINSPSTKMMEVAGHLISGLLKGLWDGLTGLISSIGKWAGSILDSIGGFFKGALNKGKDLINNIGNGAKSAWTTTKSWFTSTANSIAGFFSGPIRTMKTIGQNLISGLTSGMESMGYSLKSAVTNTANKVTGWFKDVFGIKSPSKVFAEMGMFLDLGLAKGIEDHTDSAYDAAKGLGDDTVEGMEKSGLSKVLTDLNDSLQSDFDNEIIIRPVLDLSEIQNGKNKLSNMMSDIDSYDISGSNAMANRTRDEINRDNRKFSDGSKDGSGNGVSNSEVINNTFHITGANAKDIADEVSRVLQIQVDRRKAKWAL